jgi:hypothetical protein
MGVGVAVATSTARANDCLTAPNALTPQGSHWYYLLDRASQRKCWYVRAIGQPVQAATGGPATPLHSMPAPSGPKPAADGAPMSASPSDTTSPSPHVEIHAVRPNAASVSSATTDYTAWSIPEVPGPQASTWSETSAQAAAPAPAAPVVRPDAPPAVATVEAQEPVAVLTDAPADSASDNDERTARGDDLSNNAGMPMVIFLMLGRAGVGRHSVSRCHENCRCAPRAGLGALRLGSALSRVGEPSLCSRRLYSAPGLIPGAGRHRTLLYWLKCLRGSAPVCVSGP